MIIPQKTADELKIMQTAGAKLAHIITKLVSQIVVGKTGLLIEELAQQLINEAGGKPSFPIAEVKYPFATCISIDEAIVHGLPKKEPFQPGQVVGLDVGMFYQGFHVDGAVTVGVGHLDAVDQRLINVTSRSLMLGIENIKPGEKLGRISHAIQSYVERHHFSVIRQLTGHGVGNLLHEPPSIPNFGSAFDGPELEPGMVLAIEPMVSSGDWRVKVDRDGWTVRLPHGSKGAHFEHTVAVTESGYQILTR